MSVAALKVSGFFRDWWEVSATAVFVLLCLIHVLTQFLQQEWVLTEEVYYTMLGEQLTVERINELMKSQAQFNWFSYAFIPVVLVTQTFLISLCLFIGVVLEELQLKFRVVSGMVLRSLSVFSLGRVVRTLLWLKADIRGMQDIVQADVFSLFGWVGSQTLPSWLWYPLTVVNLFEFLFIAALIIGIQHLTGKSVPYACLFVLSTYGLGLLLWVLIVIFLQLSWEM